MIVVDTNIISYFYLTSEFSDLADELYKKNPNWHAPILWKSEFGNVLLMYLRKKIISLSEASELFEAAEELLKTKEYEIKTYQTLKLAKESNCSSYDCEFVSLAKDLETRLVTMDKRILNSFPDISISMQEYIKI